MKSVRCPKCEGSMRVFRGRERTVPGGIWYMLYCPRCLHVHDYFKPRRSRPRDN